MSRIRGVFLVAVASVTLFFTVAAGTYAAAYLTLSDHQSFTQPVTGEVSHLRTVDSRWKYLAFEPAAHVEQWVRGDQPVEFRDTSTFPAFLGC